MSNSNLKTIAVVPARGGSIGVPGKNSRMLGDKPLIRHSIDFALNFKEFLGVIVSTDSSEVVEKSFGVRAKMIFEEMSQGEQRNLDNKIILHKRKTSQAQTLSRIIDTLQEISITGCGEIAFDSICLLQPTSPFRESGELQTLFELARQFENWSSIFSVAEVGGVHPERMLRLNNGQLSHYVESAELRNAPRQELERLYIKDGAYYLFRRELLKKGEMFGLQMIPLIRQGLRTINIDTQTDFDMADLVMNSTNDKNRLLM